MGKEQKPARKHHHNPSSLLGNFTDPKGLVYTIDAKLKSIRASIPEDAGFENHFYAYKKAGLPPDIFEKLYTSPLDSDGIIVIRDIIASHSIPEDENDLGTFLAYMSRLMLGSPKVRNLHHVGMKYADIVMKAERNESNWAEAKAMLRAKRPCLSIPETFVEFVHFGEALAGSKDARQNLFIDYIERESLPIIKLLATLKWCVVHAMGDYAFITSDHPISPIRTQIGECLFFPMNTTCALLGSRKPLKPYVIVPDVRVAECNTGMLVKCVRYV